MPRLFVHYAIISLLLCNLSAAQTVIPGGNVSGIWEASGSPYLIQGEITIPSSDTLAIEPGVVVIFQGHYKLIVNGWMEAIGTESDSILFTAADTSEGWHGIRFIDAPDSSHLAYCGIYDGRAWGVSLNDSCGGGIFSDNSDPVIGNCTISGNLAFKKGGGIYCSGSNPVFFECTISDNHTLQMIGSYGGGIYLTNSDASLSACAITGNSSYHLGGGIHCAESSDPDINNCDIIGNTTAGSGGGIGCTSSSYPNLTHCIIRENDGEGIRFYNGFIGQCTVTANYVTGISALGSNASIESTIVEGNSGYGIYSSNSNIEINYNDVFNNTSGDFLGSLPPGLGEIDTVNANGDSCDVYFNIFEDPLFVNPGVGDFQLQEGSPCIDAGNPSLPLDPDSTIADIGAFFFYQVYVPPEPNIEVSADTLAFDSTEVGLQAEKSLTIYNTGDTTLVLYEITTSGSGFSTNYDPADSLVSAGDSLVVTVYFTPEDTVTYSDTLSISNNDESVEVTLFGTGIAPVTPPPEISVSDSLLDFGSVLVRTQMDTSLTVYNLGDMNLVIFDVTSSDSTVFFTDFDPADSLIAAGDSLVLSVSFLPLEIGDYDEILSIENNDTLVTVALQGTGTSPVIVTLTPVNPPVVVPDSGGSFDYNIEVENLSAAPRVFDVWTQIYLPEVGSVEPLLRLDYTLPGLAAISRNRTQTVPEFAPAGTYAYYAYVGDYPWVIDDFDSFTFEKEGSDQGGSLGSLSDWLCTGENFEAWQIGALPELPEEFALRDVYPNPFNPTTAISYQLSAVRFVNLAVYDVSGRKVAELVNGWREAGVHDVTFDASDLPSGVYLARLEAGDFSAAQKMVLVK